MWLSPWSPHFWTSQTAGRMQAVCMETPAASRDPEMVVCGLYHCSAVLRARVEPLPCHLAPSRALKEGQTRLRTSSETCPRVSPLLGIRSCQM